jgi:hypothetical protein
MLRFNFKRALALILTASMALTLAACSKGSPEAVGDSPSNDRTPAALTFRDADGTIVADSSDVKSAKAKKDGSAYSVLITFTDAGKDKFAEATARLVGQTLAIYLDDEELMSPTVNEAITNGEVTIVGDRVATKEKAEEIADAIINGRKPSAAGEADSAPAGQSTADSDLINGKIKIKELNKDWVIIDLMGMAYLPDFGNGLARVAIENGKGFRGYGSSYKYGFIDTNGNIAVPFEYDKAGHFSEGYASVGKIKGEGSSDFIYEYYLIDTDGNVVFTFPPEYGDSPATAICKDGLIALYGSSLNPVTGMPLVEFIDTTGNIKIPFKYGRANFTNYPVAFNDGLAPVLEPGSRSGFIDVSGNIVLPMSYISAVQFSEGLAAVQFDSPEGKKAAYIDINGNVIIELDYALFENYSELMFSEGLAPMITKTSNGIKFMYMDKSGQIAIDTVFDVAKSFHNGLAPVVPSDGRMKFGYIDKSGNEVLPAEYSYLGYLSDDGYALAYKGGKLYLLEYKK